MVLTWTTIPVSVKQYIIGYLDYDSRCHLKLSSRDDKTVVDSTKYVAKLVSIGEQQNDGKNSTIYLRLDSKLLELKEENGELTEVFMKDLKKNEGSVIIAKFGKTRYEVARNWIDKISFGGRIEAENIRILNLKMSPSTHWLLKCYSLEIRMIGAQNLHLWLLQTAPQLKELDIQEWGISGIFDMPQVKNTSEQVKLSRNVTITDEQLEHISAPSIMIISDGSLTEKGAKKAFERYVTNSNTGDRFELKFSIPPGYNHMELFVQNWNIQQTGPHDDTEGEYHYSIIGGFSNIHEVIIIPKVIIFDFSSYMVLKVFYSRDIIMSPLFY